MLSLLKERSDKNREKLKDYDNDSFAYIYFFFDYDGHATKASDEQIEEMIAYFDNETENGKLFVSYPMVEAIKHFKDKESFRNVTVKCKRNNCPNADNCEDRQVCMNEPHYKTFVPTDSIPQMANLNSFTTWRTLIDAHLCKANLLCFGSYCRPTELITQDVIFKEQRANYISLHCPIVAVLSAFPLFVQDYYGVEKLNQKLDSFE